MADLPAEVYADAATLRQRFGELRILDQLSRGELVAEVDEDRLARPERVSPLEREARSCFTGAAMYWSPSPINICCQTVGSARAASRIRSGLWTEIESSSTEDHRGNRRDDQPVGATASTLPGTRTAPRCLASPYSILSASASQLASRMLGETPTVV